ncbi:MAG: YbjQ family protein [Planctomycetes bacterium]|nr:YbjQ family protein [Planctomycetota bacterium]
MSDFLIVTTPSVPGYRITRVFGLVRGNTVRARSIGRDILALFRNIVGGEVPEYRKLMAESREQSLEQMTDEARELGANAIVAVRMTTSMIASGMAEILLFGTAVWLEPADAE